jgi:hypothetical protein
MMMASAVDAALLNQLHANLDLFANFGQLSLSQTSLKLKEPPMPKNEVIDPITGQEIAFAHLVLSGALTDRKAAEAVGLNPDSAGHTKAKPQVRAYLLEHRAAAQQQLLQQDAKEQPRPNIDRQQVLDRLWEIANLSPEITRGSVTGQVKALTIIVAMENFIPNRLAATAEKKPFAPTPQIYASGAAGPSQSTTLKAPVPYVPLFNSVPDLGVDFSTKKTPLNPFVRPR